jgi:hypothetical protein
METAKNDFRIKWLFFSITGLILTGMGLSMVADAAITRFEGATTQSWVLYGTLALIVFNTGLCFVGQGVVYRTKM